VRITTEQLQPHLARDLGPLYTIYGGEALLALEAGDRLRAAARAQGYVEREVLTLEPGFDWNDLGHAASSQSLFATRKLLELRIPNGKPGTEGSAAIQAFCAKLPSETVTLVQLPDLDWRTVKGAWFGALAAAGTTVEACVVSRKALPKWLAGRLKAQKQDADAETLDFIAERVEGNLMAAYQEVQKLALLFPPGRLAYADVRGAVLDVTRYDIADLRTAMLEGDAARLARMLDGLKAAGAPLPLALWALTEEIRALGKVVAGAASGRPVATLMRDARIFDSTHQALVQAQYSRFTPTQIGDALRHASAVDRMIKGLTRGDVWDEMLQLALRFARPGATASRTSRQAAAATP
jgi:DNA polymerase-3 subunit delta